MPDIDIDFCYERRQEVIDYVVRKYGKDQVVQRIAQNGTMYQQLQMMQQQIVKLAAIVDAQNGTTIMQGLGAEIAGQQQGMPQGAGGGGKVEVNPLGAAARPNVRADTAARRATNTTQAQ